MYSLIFCKNLPFPLMEYKIFLGHVKKFEIQEKEIYKYNKLHPLKILVRKINWEVIDKIDLDSVLVLRAIKINDV